MIICDYGCNQIAKYKLKNGKWCCTQSTNSCVALRETRSRTNRSEQKKRFFRLKEQENRSNYKQIDDPSIICDYGCEKEAKFQLKNGKVCCCRNVLYCPNVKQKVVKANKSDSVKEKIRRTIRSSNKLKEPNLICEYGCNRLAKYKFKNGRVCCEDYTTKCSEVIRKNSEKNKIKQSGKSNGMYGKKQSPESRMKNSNSNKKMWRNQTSVFNSEDYRRKISIGSKNTIEKIKSQYLLFSIVEEMRYKPGKEEERIIQVHCKNHKCRNSKERCGWFTPTSIQFSERLRSVETYGVDLSYFYCSQKCKDSCPLYNSKGVDPLKTSKPYTEEEYIIWKKQVLKDCNYMCQICNSKENLHCHHIIPVKLEPMFSLDLTNGMVLCQSCHYRYGHKEECSTGNLANKVCQKG